MSEVRHRKPTPTESADNDSINDHDQAEDQNQQRGAAERKRERQGITLTFLDILRVLVTLSISSLLLSYFLTNGESLLWGYRPWFTKLDQIKAAWVSTPSPPSPLPIPTSNPPSVTGIVFSRQPARQSPPNLGTTLPLQWHRPLPPHLPRSQWHHLRRLRLPTHLRPRRLLPQLRRRGRDPRIRDGLLRRRPHRRLERGGGDVYSPR